MNPDAFKPGSTPSSDRVAGGEKALLPAVNFDTREAFAKHVIESVRIAEREILLADADFDQWPWSSSDFEEALAHFLRVSRTNRVLLLAGADEWSQRFPRVERLLRLFSQNFQCRQVDPALRARFSERLSLLIVDRSRIVRRFHPSSMRGAMEFAPERLGLWVDQFMELWDEAAPGPGGTVLGL